MMTKDGLIFEANSLKQGRLQALTRQQLQAQATQNRERRWVAPSAPSRSDRFWLLELRVFQTFLDNLRIICSVHGYSTQGAASTYCLARIVSGCSNSAFSRHFSTFYGSSVQYMDTQ